MTPKQAVTIDDKALPDTPTLLKKKRQGKASLISHLIFTNKSTILIPSNCLRCSDDDGATHEAGLAGLEVSAQG
jgi:hypothetical protein